MVLSNKKLKQKFRSLSAESIAASESSTKSRKESSKEDVSGELQSIKGLLSSQSWKKPKSPHRKRRRKERPLAGNPKADEETEGTQKGNDENALKTEEKKKRKQKKKKKEEGKIEEASDESKKRKREDEADQGLIEEAKKKKEKKKPKKKKEEKIEKASESANAESNGEMVEKAEEPVKIDESENKKVYVGGIPYYSSEDDIRSFFEGCGTVTEVDCMTFPESGKFRGIAILTFKTEAAAKRALALDGSDMGGFYLKIQPYKPQRTQKQKPEFTPKIVDGYNRVYVGNLSWDITEDHLKQLFSDCKISSIRFGTDKETGDFKGYAHVDFDDTVSLTIALKLDQKVVCGRPVKISCAVPKKGADVNSRKMPAAKKAENVGTGGSSKKRRTCYECGVPGHLSSACPRRKAAEAVGADAKS